jgi:DNA-binding NarL/FixJ family response regulator
MAEKTPYQQKKLLVIDDDPNLILLVQDYLEFQGYMVKTAGNGIEALKTLEDYSPDLIICDVMMPEMDGYALVETIRHNPQMNWIPVLFLSAKGQSEDRIKGLQKGADIYLIKPFEPEELVAQVESSLNQIKRILDHNPQKIENNVSLKVPLDIQLTPTEFKVVQLVAKGMGNREIAQILKVSQRTVESHVSNMLNKTSLHNRTELARWAIESNQA